MGALLYETVLLTDRTTAGKRLRIVNAEAGRINAFRRVGVARLAAPGSEDHLGVEAAIVRILSSRMSSRGNADSALLGAYGTASQIDLGRAYST